jgi:hypothetical protein
MAQQPCAWAADQPSPHPGYALCDQLISHIEQENGTAACACAAEQPSAHPGYALCDQLISHIAQENGPVACACAAEQPSAHPGYALCDQLISHIAQENGTVACACAADQPSPIPVTPCVTSSFPTLRKKWHGSLRMHSWSAIPPHGAPRDQLIFQNFARE